MKKEIGIFILLALLCGFASSKHQWHFLDVYNLQNNARLIGMYGIMSIGAGLVIITGGVDLSIGSVLALEGVFLAMMLADRNWFWPWAIAAALGGAILLGSFHGFLVAKVRIQPFILTLCGLLVYRSLARYVSDDTSKGFGESEYGSLRWLATGELHLHIIPARLISSMPSSLANISQFINSPPMPFITFILIAILMWVLLHWSVYGRYLFAVGRNEEAARYSGVKSRLVIGSAYMLCTLLTAISGIIFSLDTNSVQGTDFGLGYELTAIAAAVLGGCSLSGGEGSIIGIVIGTALLQVIQNVANLMGIPSPLTGALMGAIIFFGVLVDQLLMYRKRKRA